MTARLTVLGLVALCTSCMADTPAAPDREGSTPVALQAPATGISSISSTAGKTCHEQARHLDEENLRVAERTADEVVVEDDGARVHYYGVAWTKSPVYADRVTRLVVDGEVRWTPGITHQRIRWFRPGERAWVRAWGSRDICKSP